MTRRIVSVRSVHGSVVDLDLSAAASHYWDWTVMVGEIHIWSMHCAAAQDSHDNFW